MPVAKKPLTPSLIWTGDIVQPGTLEWNFAEKPPHTTFNWAWNLYSQNLAHIHENGIPEWDSITSYNKGAMTLSNGILYQALQANQNETPPIPPATSPYWFQFRPAKGEMGDVWLITEDYFKGDIVSWNDDVYVALAPIPANGADPATNPDWKINHGAASSTELGLVKARFENGVLYLRNDGVDA
jgi:hypothetical protein